MDFNADKCKVMHLGNKNLLANFEINNSYLTETTEEKDLGVIISRNMKVGPQCVQAVKNANKVLGMIKRTFDVRDKNVVINLYKSLVRPHLEYCMSAWRPYLVKDIDLLEGVQRRATKLVQEFPDLSYYDRLKKSNLTSLETKRIRGDIIEIFKIYHGLTDLDPGLFFTPSQIKLRGHNYKIFKDRVFSNVGKYSFSYRVIDEWNSLPESVVNSASLNIFKNSIDLIIKEDWGLI